MKERRADLALAGLSSDAFRKQFGSAEVTSIDKIVPCRRPGAGVVHHEGGAGQRSARQSVATGDEQAVAQLLSQDDEILVCSYLLRTAGQY